MGKNFYIQEAKKVQEDGIEDDENLFELEIKNLDTNEVYKMHIPVTQSNEAVTKQITKDGVPTAMIDLKYASKRKSAAMVSNLIRFLTIGKSEVIG